MVQKQSLPYNDFADFVHTLHHDIGLHKDAAMHLVIQNSQDTLFQELFNKMKKHKVVDCFKQDCYEEFKNSKDLVLLVPDIDIMHYFRNGDCVGVALPETIEQFYNSFVIPKNSPFLPYFKNAIYNLQETGVINQLARKYLLQAESCSREKQKPKIGVTKMNMENVFGIFIVFAFGIITSFFVLLIECALKGKLY